MEIIIDLTPSQVDAVLRAYPGLAIHEAVTKAVQDELKVRYEREKHHARVHYLPRKGSHE